VSVAIANGVDVSALETRIRLMIETRVAAAQPPEQPPHGAPRSAPTIAAVVLAGRWRRMARRNKLWFADKAGKSMIARVVGNVLSSKAQPCLSRLMRRAAAA